MGNFRSFSPGIRAADFTYRSIGGEESGHKPCRRWQNRRRRRKMRRRIWLRSARRGRIWRQTEKEYLVGAVGLLLAEPLDLHLELPDLLLHVHGASRCLSVTLTLDLRPCPCVARVLGSWPRPLAQWHLAGYFRCRGPCGR